MDLKLQGKHALVTGSSKGIGEAVARVLAHEGAIVTVHGRDREQTERVASSIISQGGQAQVVIGDLTEDEAVERLVRDAEKGAGAVAILVNNAGGSGGVKETWESSQPASWASAYDRNVLAALRVTTRVLPNMRLAKWGRVINITSVVGEIGQAGQANYAASKAGLIGLTKSLARELASRTITVNAVAPGYIETAMTAVLTEEQRAAMTQHIPLQRAGTDRDIAAAVAFLASEGASYITGHTLDVNGGMYMG